MILGMIASDGELINYPEFILNKIFLRLRD